MLVSVIIPNHNGSHTIGTVLERLLSENPDIEVIVVDDASEDTSVDVISAYDCTLIRFSHRKGAACARNTGAMSARGEILFFTDADCIVKGADVLRWAVKLQNLGRGWILGGTYRPIPADNDFFSTFQSLFIHYSETKNHKDPDYIATHAMFIYRDDFLSTGGFREDLFPILEDVEFSHRARSSGLRLCIDPSIQVVHKFNFNLKKSLQNAFRKSYYWVRYSLRRKDIFSDSGTASHELKSSVTGFSLIVLSLLMSLKWWTMLTVIPVVTGFNIYMCRRLFKFFYREKGLSFTLKAMLYMFFVYPVPIVLATVAALLRHISDRVSSNLPQSCSSARGS